MPEEDKTTKEKVPRKLVEDPDYTSIYVNGAFGSVNPVDGYLVFYQLRVKTKPHGADNTADLAVGEVEQRTMVEIRMSPAVFKAVTDMMIRQTANLEAEAMKALQKLTQKEGALSPDQLYG